MPVHANHGRCRLLHDRASACPWYGEQKLLQISRFLHGLLYFCISGLGLLSAVCIRIRTPDNLQMR